MEQIKNNLRKSEVAPGARHEDAQMCVLGTFLTPTGSYIRDKAVKTMDDSNRQAGAISSEVSEAMKRAGALALEAALDAEASQEEAAVAVYTAMLSAVVRGLETSPSR